MNKKEIELALTEELNFYINFQPFEDENEWLIIFPGEEDGRRPAKKEIKAITFVQIALTTKDDIIKCLRKLHFSNQRLQEMSIDNEFDRQRIKLKANKIRFSIAWYDFKYFKEKSEDWKNNTHKMIFKGFNVTVDDLIVEHFIVK